MSGPGAAPARRAFRFVRNRNDQTARVRAVQFTPAMHTDSIRVSPDRPARDATATLGRSPQRSRRRGRKPVPTPAPTARRQEAAMVPSTTANVVILGLLAVGIALIGLFMYAILFSFSQPGL